MDILSTGSGELIYECGSSTKLFNSAFLGSCDTVRNSYYCYNCTNSHDLFGCVSLNRKQYCIFNKQYTKEEYEKIVGEIIASMQKTGEWGEFFPPSIAPFCFNESNAYEHFTLTEPDAKKIGSCWQSNDYHHKHTGPYYSPKPIVAYSIKNNNDAQEEIDRCLKGVLKCEVTGRPYKIIPQELALAIKLNIELPTRHPDQRHKERLECFNKMNLYKRECMCDEENHSHRGKCKQEFETTFEPDRPEQVFCEECYQKEVM
jgi:hypothetical protein